MTLISKAALRGLAAAAALALGSFGAQAGTWDYTQSFGANGTVSGQFTGVDTNTDGVIEYNDGEVSVMTINYTGPQGNLSFASTDPFFFVSSFTWATSELGGLSNPMTSFDILASPASGVGKGVWWLAGTMQGFETNGIDAAGTLQIFDENGLITQFDSPTLPTISVPPVTPVPEPESYLMMAIGLAGIAAAKRRKVI